MGGKGRLEGKRKNNSIEEKDGGGIGKGRRKCRRVR